MATYTANFNLKKPASTDFVDVADFNSNADIIDAELKNRAELGADGKVKSEQLPEMSFDPTDDIEAAITEHNASGSAHNDIRNLANSKSPKALVGSSAPTTTTVGEVGQLYINTSDGSIYVCTAVSGSSYTWKLKTWATEAQVATKQDASTAITTSNIGSQTVSKAKFATDDVAVGTAALRNQYFSATEQTPTVDGQICWVYG